MEKKWLYKVENDKISVLLSLIVTVIFAAVTAVLHGFIITLVFTIVMAALTLCSAYRFIFIKLLIGEDSFCHCKSPWDKRCEPELFELQNPERRSGKILFFAVSI